MGLSGIPELDAADAGGRLDGDECVECIGDDEERTDGFLAVDGGCAATGGAVYADERYVSAQDDARFNGITAFGRFYEQCSAHARSLVNGFLQVGAVDGRRVFGQYAAFADGFDALCPDNRCGCEEQQQEDESEVFSLHRMNGICDLLLPGKIRLFSRNIQPSSCVFRESITFAARRMIPLIEEK